MKVMPQIVVFLVLVALGGAAYQYHPPFKRLIDDIVQVSGMMEPVTVEPASQPEPVVIPVIESRSEVVTYAADAEPEAAKAGAQEGDITMQKAKSTSAIGEQPSDVVVAESQPLASDADVTPLPGSATPSEVFVPEQPMADAPPRSEEVFAPQPSAQAPAGMMPGRAMPGRPGMPAEPSFRPPVGMMPGQVMPRGSVMPVKPPAQPPFGAMPTENATRETMPPEPVQPEESLVEQDSKQREQQAVAGLTAAREAWQQGDEAAAVARYTELMEQYPNHPDFAGELGNIYFAKGQHEQAVEAYSEAFARLVRNNDYERAWQLLNVIRRMDFQRASQLERYFAR